MPVIVLSVVQFYKMPMGQKKIGYGLMPLMHNSSTFVYPSSEIEFVRGW